MNIITLGYEQQQGSLIIWGKIYCAMAKTHTHTHTHTHTQVFFNLEISFFWTVNNSLQFHKIIRNLMKIWVIWKQKTNSLNLWMDGLLFIPSLARPHTRWHNADLRWREYLATANIIIPVLQMEWNEFPSLSGNIDQASSKRALNKMSF